MRRFVGSACAIGLVAMAGCASAPLGMNGSAGAHPMAPDFELTDLGGAKVRLSDFRGKPVLLGFWAVG